MPLGERRQDGVMVLPDELPGGLSVHATDASPERGKAPGDPGPSVLPERANSDFGHLRAGLVVLTLEAVGGRPVSALVHLPLELADALLRLLPRAAAGPGPGQEPDTHQTQRPHPKQLHGSPPTAVRSIPVPGTFPGRAGGKRGTAGGQKPAARPSQRGSEAAVSSSPSRRIRWAWPISS